MTTGVDMRLIAMVGAALIWANFAQANGFDQIFRQIAADEKSLTKSAKLNGYRGAQIPVAVDHMQRVFSSAAARKFIGDKIGQVVPLNKKGVVAARHYPRMFTEMGKEMNNAAILGMRELPANQQLAFWRSAVTLYSKSSQTNCAAIFGGNTPQTKVNKAKRQGLVKLTPQELQTYLKYFRAGIFAHISPKGAPRRLSAGQTAQVETAIERAMDSALVNHPNKRGIEANWQGNSNKPRDVCDAGLLSSMAVLQLPKSLQPAAAVYMLGE